MIGVGVGQILFILLVLDTKLAITMLAVIEGIIIVIFGIMHSTVTNTMVFTVYVAAATVIFTIIIIIAPTVGIFAIIQIVLLIGVMFLL